MIGHPLLTREFVFSSVYINWNNPGSNKFKATWKKVASKKSFYFPKLLSCVLFLGVLLPNTNTNIMRILNCSVVCCSSVRMESSGGAASMYSDFMVTVRHTKKFYQNFPHFNH